MQKKYKNVLTNAKTVCYNTCVNASWKGVLFVDVNKLKDKMATSRKSAESMAGYLGINVSTFYRKMNGESDFTRNEIMLITSFLGLSSADVFAIFFAKELA